MRSPFKFPCRVRIHGGECDAVARALHHEAQKVALTQNEQTLISDECVFFRQADLGKVPSSTNERKQMSTKTSIKRIALVAVSALGFGLLSVVPAKAAGSSTVGSIYVSKYSIASGYSATFLGATAAVAADGTAVTLTTGTFAAGTHEGYGIYANGSVKIGRAHV